MGMGAGRGGELWFRSISLERTGFGQAAPARRLGAIYRTLFNRAGAAGAARAAGPLPHPAPGRVPTLPPASRAGSPAPGIAEKI
jgi:hypothetical protein